MKRIQRQQLPPKTSEGLEKYQRAVQEALPFAKGQADTHWANRRDSNTLTTVRKTLLSMSGPRERCMYCSDSQASDIEHFWPKSIYPERMYKWLNLLLCCATCGNHKRALFPLDLEGKPRLVDPTDEKPWDFLDFDPDTGNFTARFDLGLNDFSPKGTETVKLLHLDRRESLAIGHRQSLKRLKALAQSADCTREALEAEDDYGLLPYLLRGETDLSMDEIRSKLMP